MTKVSLIFKKDITVTCCPPTLKKSFTPFSQKWQIVNSFQRGVADWRAEKLPALVILTPRGMQETAIKHPAPHQTRTLFWCGGMLAVTWPVEWELTPSSAWQLYEPRGDHKDTGWRDPQLLPGLGLEKHTGTRTGCLVSQGSFLSELCLSTHSNANDSYISTLSLLYISQINIHNFTQTTQHKQASTHAWPRWKKRLFPAFHIPVACRWQMDGSVFILAARSLDDRRKLWESCISV